MIKSLFTKLIVIITIKDLTILSLTVYKKQTGFLNEKDVIPSVRQAARKKKSKYSQKERNRPRISSSKLPVSLTE